MFRKFSTLVSIIICFLYDAFSFFVRNKIFIVGYFQRRYGKLVNNNWGDDINMLFFKEIAGCKVIPQNISYLYKMLPLKNYACIGSIICRNTNIHSEVWGSGLIDETVNLRKMPSKFYSVRGPLTRQVLLKNGIDCPERYGDPALLVSKYYQPCVEKKYELGLIVHFVDEDNPMVNIFCAKHPDVLLIKMRGYSHWHDIPNQICSCKRIASSSLHGLIVSDTYDIPNLWIRLSDKIYGGDFKYQDYFLSVNRTVQGAYKVNDLADFESVYFSAELFSKAENINYDDIYNACPFKDKFNKWKI